MIPEPIGAYLKDRRLSFEHTVHRRAVAAQHFAAAEHVTGHRIAKPVVVELDGRLVLAVVSAAERVDLAALRRATGARRSEVAPETAFSDRFDPCEVGAEPPLELFGVPVYVDARLAEEPWILVRGGTHEDALRLDTASWLASEHVTRIEGLGRPMR